MYFTNRFHLVKQLNDHNVVKFKDPLVEQLLIQHNPSLKQGNITLYDLAQYKNISGIFYNSDIQYFDEFKYFTGLKYIGGIGSLKDLKNNFDNCNKLKTIAIPLTISFLQYGCFVRTGLETLILPENIKIFSHDELIVSNPNLKLIIIKSDTLSLPTRGKLYFFRNHPDLKIYCKPKVYEVLYNRYIETNIQEFIPWLVKYENENELPKL